MTRRDIEDDLIRRGDVLELLYRIKNDREWPKNYGTLLTIINHTWSAPGMPRQNLIAVPYAVGERIWFVDTCTKETFPCKVANYTVQLNHTLIRIKYDGDNTHLEHWDAVLHVYDIEGMLYPTEEAAKKRLEEING